MVKEETLDTKSFQSELSVLVFHLSRMTDTMQDMIKSFEKNTSSDSFLYDQALYNEFLSLKKELNNLNGAYIKLGNALGNLEKLLSSGI